MHAIRPSFTTICILIIHKPHLNTAYIYLFTKSNKLPSVWWTSHLFFESTIEHYSKWIQTSLRAQTLFPSFGVLYSPCIWRPHSGQTSHLRTPKTPPSIHCFIINSAQKLTRRATCESWRRNSWGSWLLVIPHTWKLLNLSCFSPSVNYDWWSICTIHCSFNSRERCKFWHGEAFENSFLADSKTCFCFLNFQPKIWTGIHLY